MDFEKYLYKKGNNRWRLLYNPLGMVKNETKTVAWTNLAEFEEKNHLITWFCGVEVHKLHIVWAFYGYFQEKRIEGPVLRCLNTVDDLKRFFLILKNFNPTRFLMETI